MSKLYGAQYDINTGSRTLNPIRRFADMSPAGGEHDSCTEHAQLGTSIVTSSHELFFVVVATRDGKLGICPPSPSKDSRKIYIEEKRKRQFQRFLKTYFCPEYYRLIIKNSLKPLKRKFFTEFSGGPIGKLYAPWKALSLNFEVLNMLSGE
jgi:hypothetical protein